MISRRAFLRGTAAGAFITAKVAFAGRRPPPEADSAYRVFLPDFMDGLIREHDVDRLNATIPALFDTYRDWLPALEAPPQYIVVNTMTDTLVHHGSTLIGSNLLGDEALTLLDLQFLLVTTRFGSVATPHRGANLDLHGQYVYLKQHPRAGYNTPEHLLIEEMLHVQQDVTVMRNIIEREQLDPTTCLHAQLKGISELGVHHHTDTLTGEPDYVFVLDDNTHCESAEHGVQLLAERLETTEAAFVRAITYDLSLYNALDRVAMSRYDKHIWEMVTTWRHARDADGNVTDIAPAFQPFG